MYENDRKQSQEHVNRSSVNKLNAKWGRQRGRGYELYAYRKGESFASKRRIDRLKKREW